MPVCPEKDDLKLQLPILLPPGRAFQTTDHGVKSYSSTIRQFFAAISDEVWRMDQEICNTFAEFFCHTTVDDLDRWMDEFGLPDECDPFGNDLCAKVATAGEEGGDTAFLMTVADRMGWVVRLRWLDGAHADYPGIRSALLVEIDQVNSPAAVITDMTNWVLPESPLGDTTEEDVSGIICNYERILPAHLALFSRNLLFRLGALLPEDGLGPGLELALDAGDGLSYTSGQTWTDRSPAGTNHYFLGATSGAEGSDPTFNGVADRRSDLEFFSLDGGDYFAPSGAQSFGPNWHKDNAIFSIMAIFKPVASASSQILLSTSNAAAGTGMRLRIDQTTGVVSLIVLNAGTFVYSAQSVVAPVVGQMNFLALSINEATGVGFIQVGETVLDIAPVYVSPAAGAPDGGMVIGATADFGAPMASGSQIAAIAVWDGVAIAASKAEDVRRVMRNRWPSI